MSKFKSEEQSCLICRATKGSQKRHKKTMPGWKHLLNFECVTTSIQPQEEGCKRKLQKSMLGANIAWIKVSVAAWLETDGCKMFTKRKIKLDDSNFFLFFLLLDVFLLYTPVMALYRNKSRLSYGTHEVIHRHPGFDKIVTSPPHNLHSLLLSMKFYSRDS